MIELSDNTQRARNIIICLWCELGINIVSLISNYMELSLLQTGGYSLEEAERNDLRQQIINITQFAVYIITAVFFILWFRRAYGNLWRINGTGLGFPENWAVWSWFVPFLNLVRPYQIMKEIWNETQYKTKGIEEHKETHLIGWWWALFLFMSIYSRLLVKLEIDYSDYDSYTRGEYIMMGLDVTMILAAIITINLIRQTSELETSLRLSLEKEEEPESEFLFD